MSVDPYRRAYVIVRLVQGLPVFVNGFTSYKQSVAYLKSENYRFVGGRWVKGVLRNESPELVERYLLPVTIYKVEQKKEYKHKGGNVGKE